MSIEASVEELYKDDKDEEWKTLEVARLKAEQGIIDIEEPAVNYDLEMNDNDTDTNVDTKVENQESGQKEDKTFKPTPPDFDYKGAYERRKGTMFECFCAKKKAD